MQIASRCLALGTLSVLLLFAVSAPLTGQDEDAGAEAYQSGSEALRDSNFAVATAALETASGLRPDDFDVWLKLGIARSGLQDWDGAIQAYRRSIEIDPRSARAFNNIANVHFRKGDYQAAADAYGRALEIDPGYILAAFHRGWMLRQLNRAEEAETVFRDCLRIPAENDRDRRTRVDCLFGLGSMQHRAEDYESSAVLMEQVLAVHPGHTEARYYLGMAYRQLGRLEEAAQQLEIHRKLMQSRRKSIPIERPIEP